MGRIKSTLIKRTAKTLEEQGVFSEEFNNNKRILGNSLPSKSMRNKIAGHITRLARRRNKERIILEGQENNKTGK